MTSSLTFGVEFEFLVATLGYNLVDPHPDDERWVRDSKDTYAAYKKRQKDSTMANLGPYMIGIRDDDLSLKITNHLKSVGLPAVMDDIYPPSDTIPEHSRWNVGHDSSLTSQKVDNTRYTWHEIEVRSPAYVFCPQSLEAIRIACEILTSSFRIDINSSCGLHVHVGYGGQEFDLDTIQHLMALLWTFEPQITRIHPESRADIFYARSMRAYSVLAFSNEMTDEKNNKKLVKPFGLVTRPVLKRILNQDAITKIFSYKDITLDMITSLSSGRYMHAYNLKNLRKSHGSYSQSDFLYKSKQTIEFRQHEGTLDPDRIITWIKTVVGLVEIALYSDRFLLLELLTEHVMAEDEGKELIGIVELLEMLGLHEPAIFYKNRLEQLGGSAVPENPKTEARQLEMEGKEKIKINVLHSSPPHHGFRLGSPSEL